MGLRPSRRVARPPSAAPTRSAACRVRRRATTVADDRDLVHLLGPQGDAGGPDHRAVREESGVRVEVKYATSSQLAATLLEEGDDSPADVFFAQEPASLGAVAGLLAPLPESILGRVPEWARSSDGRWVGVSGRARVVVYNTDALTEADLPDDLWGFVAAGVAGARGVGAHELVDAGDGDGDAGAVGGGADAGVAPRRDAVERRAGRTRTTRRRWRRRRRGRSTRRSSTTTISTSCRRSRRPRCRRPTTTPGRKGRGRW